MIRTVIAFCLVTAGAFVAVFSETHDTWTAVNVASLIAAAGLIAVTVIIVRRPVSRKFRWIVSIGAAVLILGTAYNTVIMYRMSRWQYSTLHLIHKVIQHGVARWHLADEGTRVLEAYYRDNRKKLGLGDVYRRTTEFVDQEEGIVTVDSGGQMKILAATMNDSEVVLVALSTIRVDGEDPLFRNIDGSLGAVQDRMRITRKGMSYEFQN